MAGSIFSRIIAGQIPCQRVFENEHVLAFLDIHPLAEGHTLIVPKREVAHFEDLTADEAAELARAVRLVAQRVLSATGASAYNLLLNNGEPAGQEVPHVHVHLIPRRPDDGLGFRWKPQQRTPQELDALARRIQGTL